METSFAFPEIVVFGLKPADARGLLGMVVELLRDGVVVPVGPAVRRPPRQRLALGAATPGGRRLGDRCSARRTDWYGDAPYRVVQLAYPDPDGWMPWEAGLRPPSRLSQPVIGSLDHLDEG